MSNRIKEIAGLAFANRRNNKGKLGVKHRQMRRRELETLIRRGWDDATIRAAEIARRHEDDDDRGIKRVVLAIAEEIEDVAS